jgi:hypothetical protein
MLVYPTNRADEHANIRYEIYCNMGSDTCPPIDNNESRVCAEVGS